MKSLCMISLVCCLATLSSVEAEESVAQDWLTPEWEKILTETQIQTLNHLTAEERAKALVRVSDRSWIMEEVLELFGPREIESMLLFPPETNDMIIEGRRIMPESLRLQRIMENEGKRFCMEYVINIIAG